MLDIHSDMSPSVFLSCPPAFVNTMIVVIIIIIIANMPLRRCTLLEQVP